jgi:hypothetical protein
MHRVWSESPTVVISLAGFFTSGFNKASPKTPPPNRSAGLTVREESVNSAVAELGRCGAGALVLVAGFRKDKPPRSRVSLSAAGRALRLQSGEARPFGRGLIKFQIQPWLFFFSCAAH